ncbi:MAG TPA: mannose-1-phosphate guanylyltransferase [Thermodesulfobacteriota bacterium]|jgi:mannose-1-phosphate guanylyltransferase
MHLFALIMAGGEGKRFWPLSRKDRPKQFLNLIGGKSLLRQTVERILPLIPYQNIFVVTVERYLDETRRHLPGLPLQNIIIEPEGKNTAPCIALGTLKIKKISPDSTILVLPADHAIVDDQSFRDVIQYGQRIANIMLPSSDYPLVTLGVKPRKAETGYGYIKESTELVNSSAHYNAKRILKFIEKPDLKTATNLVNEGGYYWNSGIFIWKTTAILNEFSEILPEWYKYFDGILDSFESSYGNLVFEEFYKNIQSGSIDKLILERSENGVVIPVDFSWSDVGTWQALDEFLRSDEVENINIGNCISLDSTSCLLFAQNRLIAAVGVKNLVIVETDDAILVLDKDKAQDVKELVERLDLEKD